MEAPAGGTAPFLISDLCALLETYLEPAQVAEVYRAYLFGAEAHEGQHRMTGEPYIYHPLEVARILAEMHMDHQSIVAAILHDVIEDTPTAKEHISTEFGEDIAELVDGVSKLTHIEFESRAEAQAENFRKMLLAMVRDIRVILVKLADRLHNMRTLGIMPADKRRRIARETLEIYAPIANRLGMNSMRLELEDLGFAAMYPTRYRVIAEAIRKARGNRKEIVHRIQDALEERLRQEGLIGHVVGREKHLYSIYKKMHVKGVSFSDVMDIYAFRIIVDSVDTCYRVLGAVHNLYKPVPGRFKDYIAIPKANGYQSLHTVLFAPYGVPIEVQIRTEDMDKVAEAGIAAHWLYKSGAAGGNSAQVRAREWLRGLLEMQQNAGNSLEFLENVKIDLFPDEVYVFTPKGDIMALPRGATAVDFAYAVHTDVGRSCVAVKIDRRLMPLRTELRNGQTVEIITAPGARPNPAWLNFVLTAKARSNIRAFLKNLKHDEAVALGRRMLDKVLASWGSSFDALPPASVERVMAEYGFKELDGLLEEVGLGNRIPLVVARALTLTGEETAGGPAGAAGEPVATAEPSGDQRPLAIKGTEGTVVTFAKCCRPIPGDPILGFVTAGRGIVIHTQNCKNVADYRAKPEKWIDVQWESQMEGEFPVEVRMVVVNQRGVLATVAAAIAEMDANIENVTMEERDGMYTTLTFTVTVHNRQHLARIMRHLRSLEMVVRINRTKG
ncbi:MAG TPA: bifunctional GTP diphosphokinase/guanosine-3',5'-bis pyrophosphate 3'-pyrophosphohydrolase [Gammaproteobacteria bacterium]|nr:bifunctional GTP diphosphokinase/guanosine-3',5'-bis pyrophosphate 3'-pyrophosphohydrolase [Gammaproteobacteria bacterium]